VRVARILTYDAMVVAIVMLLGSCDYKTRREDAGASTRRTSTETETDSFYQWAALTSLCSLIAITLLGNVMATIAPQHGGPPRSTAKASGLATVALALFALGANIAWSYWMRVIAEQQRANYAVHIAYGLPTVTYTGALGAAICALLILALLSAKGRADDIVPRSESSW
jgi:hypothetical protein